MQTHINSSSRNSRGLKENEGPSTKGFTEFYKDDNSFLQFLPPLNETEIIAKKEPVLDAVIGVKDLLDTISAGTLSALAAEYKGLGSSNASTGNMKRYLYSPKWGWLDMKHFASSADWADSWYVSGYMVLKEGEKQEIEQLKSGDDSAFDYEDLPSNLLGVYFERYLEKEEAKKKTFSENLGDYLYKLGFVDDPEEVAPNGLNVSHHEKGKEPMNFSYDPMFTTEEADDELSAEIKGYIADYRGKK